MVNGMVRIKRIRVLLLDNSNYLSPVIEAFLKVEPEINLLGNIIITDNGDLVPVTNIEPDVVLIGIRYHIASLVGKVRAAYPNSAIILMTYLDGMNPEKMAAQVSADSCVDKMRLVEDLVPEIKRINALRNAK
jgi:hypothetical protein